MHTWGPQSAAPASPPPPAPVASFYGLVDTGSAAYDSYIGFSAGTGVATVPGGYLEATDAQASFFSPHSGAGDPQTWEGSTGTSDGALAEGYTDAAADVEVDITATTGRIADLGVGVDDGSGRFSVAWYNGSYQPADGGAKLLIVLTSEQTVTFTFSKLVASFGLYLVDYLDFGGECTWSFYNGATLVFSEVVQPSPFVIPGDEPLLDGSVGFIGYVARTTDAPFDSVTLSFTDTSSDRTGFDNIFVGSLDQQNFVNVTAGQTVQFTDTSTNTPTSWLWNFGDSTTSTSQNPTKTYSTPGTYTVTLTATNAGGSDMETKTNLIVVT